MEKQTPREAQALRIQSLLNEPTKAALVADEPGYGKTLVAVESAAAFDRVLIVGIRDTFDAFADLMLAQTDGRVALRRIDSTAPGKRALADLLAGEPGHYFAGAQYLVRQDWEIKPAFHPKQTGEPWRPKFKSWTKTDPDDLILVPQNPDEELFWKAQHYGKKCPKGAWGKNVIGPALVPIRESKSTQKKIYKGMPPLDLLVFDEVHLIQNRKGNGFKTLQTIPTEYKLGMSGTPQGNKFPGLWAVCRFLWPDLIDVNYVRWEGMWCTTETVYRDGQPLLDRNDEPVLRVVGEKYPGEFVKTLPLYFRAEAEPIPAPTPVLVDLSPAQRYQYESLERDLIVWIEDHPLAVDLPVTLRQRLRTATLGELAVTENGEVYFDPECRSSKLQALSGVLRFWGPQHAIIGMDSKQFADITYERMLRAGESVALWTGDTSEKKRAEVKRAFLAGEVQYIVATIGSMSTGLDGFQKVCNKVAWLNELDGDEATNEQFIRRTFRPGRTEENGGFQHVKLLARDTKDLGVWSANTARSFGNRTSLRLAA